MSVNTERDLVCRLASTDWRRAYKRAEAIIDVWYRRQALACVARFAPTPEVIRVAGKALSASDAAADPYQRLAAQAWPIRALIERGYTADAERAAGLAIRHASEIENPVNRVDALFLVWQAVYPLGPRARNEVLTPLMQAARAANSWKPQRVLQSVVFMLPADERTLADEIVEAMPPGKYKRTTARRLAAGEHQEPRPFFWGHAARNQL
jgi:hypothetical protein